ncbi:MAG: AI-2E family transporter [Spirochaetes bacterium]|nr:AI-2E family transporter [Spirochaetota bacterium]
METSINGLLKNIFIILLGFFFMVILYFTHIMVGFLVPIFFAFFTSMFLYPFIHKLHQTRVPNWLSTLIVYLLFILVISIFLTILGVSFGNFVADLPEITREFRDKLVDLIKRLANMEVVKKYIYKEEIMNMLLDVTGKIISIENFKVYIIKPVGVTLDIFKGFGLYALALIFIIPGMSKISDKMLKAFPDESGPKINNIITNINEQIQNYMVAKSIISFATGLISFLICLIFGVKYALLWGVVIFLFNYIPIIGSIIAVIFPISLSIIQYQSFSRFALLASCLIGLQIIIGNIVEPKFMSRGVNLSPLIIFISLLVWGYIWGIAGVILSVPIMSAFNLICENIDSLKPISILISAKKKKKKKLFKKKGD